MKHEINSKEEIVNLSALANAWSAVLKNGENEIKPQNCPEEFGDICLKCEFRSFEMVSHPGGESTSLVEKSRCDLEFWEDDF